MLKGRAGLGFDELGCDESTVSDSSSKEARRFKGLPSLEAPLV